MKKKFIVYVVVIAFTISAPLAAYLILTDAFAKQSASLNELANKLVSQAERIESGEVTVYVDSYSKSLKFQAEANRSMAESFQGYGSAIENFFYSMLGAALVQAILLFGFLSRKYEETKLYS